MTLHCKAIGVHIPGFRLAGKRQRYRIVCQYRLRTLVKLDSDTDKTQTLSRAKVASCQKMDMVHNDQQQTEARSRIRVRST